MMIFFLQSGVQSILAQKASQNEAIAVAANYISKRLPELSVTSAELLLNKDDTLAWVVNCLPRGFVVIAPTLSMTPILAWSDEGNFGDGEAWNIFQPIFLFDLKARKEFAETNSTESGLNRQKWDSWLDPSKEPELFQQWPPDSWSPTGGWLFTNWTQSAPYNALCPVDGQTHTRSVAGCPATAMAQIVNFHHTLNDTRFSDTDDYYHSFGSGNQYWIDNDWETYGFPDWNLLNAYLDTLEMHYQDGIPLKNNDKAALTFACGVAAQQVYSSSVSGTYGINQAYNAYERFGFSEAELIDPGNPDLNTRLAGNMMLALPAHLGLVNPEETVGHNVVVDGYTTDEFFHFNFGWGGSANGWYTMPPSDIPYDLTVIEGLVLDINLSNAPVGIQFQDTGAGVVSMIYIKQKDVVCVPPGISLKNARLTIVDASGRCVMNEEIRISGNRQATDIPLGFSGHGLFVACLQTPDSGSYSLKFVR